MNLELCEEDLRAEFQKISTQETKFEHFNDKTQGVIRSVGQATFYRYKGTSIEDSKVIFSPES